MTSANQEPSLKTYLLTLLILTTQTLLATTYTPCIQDLKKYSARSAQLQKLKKADQEDRKNGKLKPGTELRDRQRRQRVGSIFGEGCFKTSDDFSAAALIFQHGDRPEHFMQTFLWSKRAVELGDEKQKRLMLLGIDRYLVNIGHKQLFASQYYLPSLKPGTCWCLQQTEESVTDSFRLKYGGQSYAKRLAYLNELNKGLNCPLEECRNQPLEASPKGTVPGLW